MHCDGSACALKATLQTYLQQVSTVMLKQVHYPPVFYLYGKLNRIMPQKVLKYMLIQQTMSTITAVKFLEKIR